MKGGKPIGIATRETDRPLRAHVAPDAKLLGIGCGARPVARALRDAEIGRIGRRGAASLRGR